MISCKKSYLNLPKKDLFEEVIRRTNAYKKAHPEAEVIKLGVGDVTRPLPVIVVEAVKKAMDEQATEEGFKGYGPYEGYAFLREAISKEYEEKGLSVASDEIFINDGIKEDSGNIPELFNYETVALCDPVYPAYVDCNALEGKLGEFDFEKGAWKKVVYLPCIQENGFVPPVPSSKVDLIYLCFPNNPTGAMLSKEELQKFVDYALENDALILYDGAYEAYVEDEYPHSIYECEGAKKCAIELRSLSKDAGFTGLRLGYTVMPHELKMDGVEVQALWRRRLEAKYNGAPYITQKGALARFSKEGKKEVKALISYYKENARLVSEGLKEAGFEVYGGVHSPYVWIRIPHEMTSWDFFDYLLNELQIVGTPGSGFGPSGEGYFRLTAFGSRENVLKAIKRLKEWKKK
ncbi:MAG: LL-diaminopimelate aminotransferase [Alphaproteobacteria bacterium]|nr:LL-diaminopimelate aminotransferase [Alphaproteobacteria bacterium]